MHQELTLHVSFQDQTVDLSAELIDEQVSPHPGRALRRARSSQRQRVWESARAPGGFGRDIGNKR